MKYVGENALKKWTSLVKSDIKKKLDKNQGTANSGKILGVDASGEVAPTDTEVATLVDVPNGIVKGDGSTLSAAVAGTDYVTPDGVNSAVAETKPFIVTFTYNGDYHADKTFEEIKAAYDAGKMCYASLYGNIGLRGVVTNDYVTFIAFNVQGSSESIATSMGFIRIYSDNSIVTNAIQNQPFVTASGLLKGDGSGGVSAAVAGTDYMAPVTGGTTGQVLTKTADGQEWTDLENVFIIPGTKSREGIALDKTFLEIKDAYNAGKVCFLVVDNFTILHLIAITDNMAMFSASATTNVGLVSVLTVTVNDENNATITSTSCQNKITTYGLLKGNGNDINNISAAIPGTDYMVPPTGGTTGQILKKTETGTEWADAPVPDWNQNDSTAADYVKNRPFYTGGPVETVLIEESTVAFTEGSGLYIAQFPLTFEATVGETYKVSWDGTVYECVCAKHDGIPIIGNLSIVNAGSDTGEPFAIGIINGEGLFMYTTDTSSSHTFSISVMVAQVVKIDPKYLPDSFKPEGKSYITFSSPNSFTLAVENAKKNWDGTLEYFASDRTWTTWDGTAAIYSVDNYGEYVLYLRGTGNTVIAGKNYDYRWVLTGNDIKCIGNIENLLDYATVKSGNHPTMASKCYGYMFAGCNALTKAPDLPATTLASDCYLYMFSDCTNLTQAPALPATTLVDSCYNSMFRGCTSLNQAPALPATTLATQCYYYMFYGCINLTKASDLSATTLADHCCYYMFSDCTSLTQAPALPATTLAQNCYSNMFQGCTSLTQAPALPATTLASFCYSNMFQGCTSLTQAPALPATTLAQNCYRFMFRNCSKLKLSSTQTEEYVQEYRIPYSGIGTTETDALYNMFYSTGGTFTGTPEINTTYYLSSDNMVAHETEVATLREYVGSMIEGLATQEYVDGKVPDGGTTGQILKKTETGTEWADAPKSLPDGGTVGDALVKSTNGGSWETPVEASLVDLPVITASQTDLTAGTSPLATGELYVVYE